MRFASLTSILRLIHRYLSLRLIWSTRTGRHHLPTAVRIAAGSAISSFFSATDRDLLLVFTAVPANCAGAIAQHGDMIVAAIAIDWRRAVTRPWLDRLVGTARIGVRTARGLGVGWRGLGVGRCGRRVGRLGLSVGRRGSRVGREGVDLVETRVAGGRWPDSLSANWVSGSAVAVKLPWVIPERSAEAREATWGWKGS